jgi:alkylation response protein AidB-like acyl-CoA dehydrogenase
MLERYVVTEELLAAGAPVGAHWIADRQSAPLFLRYGTEEQRLAFLPGIGRGEIFFCIGMSEPDFAVRPGVDPHPRSSGRGRVRGHRRQGVDELCA